MKKIVLCADDYAQSAAISAGILQLVQQQRLSAVSCLTESEYWESDGSRLFEFRNRIDIGLHFNLTHAFPAATFTAQPLTTIMRLAIMRTLDKAQIQTALRAQLDNFERIAKQAPDFIDGHQHVHVLPVVRDIVIAELNQRYGERKPYVRAVNPRLPGYGGFLKLLVLKTLGNRFSALAKKHDIHTNSGFAGIYALQPDADFPKLLQLWLGAAQHGDLLMCHPGVASHDINDPIAATRPLELALLLSDNFRDMLSQYSIQLSRFNDIER